MLPILLLLTAVMATAAVLTRDPRRQAVVLSAYGLVMGLLILVFQAPDVAMSQLAVGAAIVPLIIVLAIGTCEREAAARLRDRAEGDDAPGSES